MPQDNSKEMKTNIPHPRPFCCCPVLSLIPRCAPLTATCRSLGKCATSLCGQHPRSTFTCPIPSAKETRIGCLSPGLLNPSISQKQGVVKPGTITLTQVSIFPVRKQASACSSHGSPLTATQNLGSSKLFYEKIYCPRRQGFCSCLGSVPRTALCT